MQSLAYLIPLEGLKILNQAAGEYPLKHSPASQVSGESFWNNRGPSEYVRGSQALPVVQVYKVARRTPQQMFPSGGIRSSLWRPLRVSKSVQPADGR
jgi:hypothetical protein